MGSYQETAKTIREKVVRLIYKAQTCHIGSCMSCVDIAVVLYANLKPEDKVVWSKGWASALQYIIEDTDTTNFPKDPPSLTEFGSAGHGLPVAVGMAIAKKRAKEPGNVYCIMSDGEMDIGTTWESAKIASEEGLNNLVVLIDANGWQAMRKTNLKGLAEKWQAFGWRVIEGDGHNYESIEAIWEEDFTGISFGCLGGDHMPWATTGDESLKYSPLVYIGHTIKGKGVDFMENKMKFHYLNLTENEYQKAILQLTN